MQSSWDLLDNQKKDSMDQILHLLFTLLDCKQDVLELKKVVVLQIQLAVSEILTTGFKQLHNPTKVLFYFEQDLAQFEQDLA